MKRTHSPPMLPVAVLTERFDSCILYTLNKAGEIQHAATTLQLARLAGQRTHLLSCTGLGKKNESKS